MVKRGHKENVPGTGLKPASLTNGELKRYYFHGDFTEHDSELVYCVKCDSFVPVAHFTPEAHPGSRDTDVERYRYQLRRRYMKVSSGFRRPPDAKNLFAQE